MAHGWDDNGVFNFEGGRYAKVINLDKDSEPDIYNAIKRNALLENALPSTPRARSTFADKSVTGEHPRFLPHQPHPEHRSPDFLRTWAAKNVIFPVC